MPFIFLSAGVSSELFQQTLVFAHESGSTFNGVLCGRATLERWRQSYVDAGKEGAVKWLRTQGRQNIENLNQVINQSDSDTLVSKNRRIM